MNGCGIMYFCGLPEEVQATCDYYEEEDHRCIYYDENTGDCNSNAARYDEIKQEYNQLDKWYGGM